MSRHKLLLLSGIVILGSCILGVSVVCLRGNYRTRLWQASHGGDAAEVRRILDSLPAIDVNEGWLLSTPLQAASQEGHVRVAELLLARGAEVDVADCNGTTALHLAALFGHPEVVDVLLANGADANVVDADGCGPLHHAAYGGYREVVRSLLSHGASAGRRDKEGLRPIDAALVGGHVEVIKCLLPKLDAPDVFVASGLGMLEHLRELLNRSPGLATLKRRDGYTALHFAAVCGQAPAAELLIMHGARVDAEADSGFTPLGKASTRSVAKVLVANGADVLTGGGQDRAPLLDVALLGRTEVADYLIEQGADVNARDSDGETPLHAAVWGGEADLVTLLIEHGANVNARSVDPDWPTPLKIAKREGHVKIADILRVAAQ